MLGGGEAETGLLRGIQAIGGIAAGLALSSTARRVAPAKLFGWGAIVFGLVAAIIWNAVYVTTSPALYFVLFIVIGAPVVIFNAGLLSVVQLATPPERTGRALSSLFAAGSLCQVLGTLGAGAIAAWVSPAVLLNAQAVFAFVAGVIALTVLRGPVATVEECPAFTPPATST